MLKIAHLNKVFVLLTFSFLLVYITQSLSSINESENYNQGLYRIALIGLYIVNFGFFIVNVRQTLKYGHPLLYKFMWLYFFQLLFLYFNPDPDMSAGTAIFRLLALTLPSLVFVNFYVMCTRKDISGLLKIMSILLFVVVSIYYYTQQKYATVILGEDTKSFNSAYVVLFITPLVLAVSNKKWLRIITLAVMGAIIFSSNKRGGLVAYALAIFIYYNLDLSLKNRGLKIKNFLYFAVIIIVGLGIFKYVAESSDGFFLYRLEKLESDGGSGRLEIYQQVVEGIGNSSLVAFIVGNGDNAVAKITDDGFSAHNDFLEIIYSYVYT